MQHTCPHRPSTPVLTPHMSAMPLCWTVLRERLFSVAVPTSGGPIGPSSPSFVDLLVDLCEFRAAKGSGFKTQEVWIPLQCCLVSCRLTSSRSGLSSSLCPCQSNKLNSWPWGLSVISAPPLLPPARGVYWWCKLVLPCRTARVTGRKVDCSFIAGIKWLSLRPFVSLYSLNLQDQVAKDKALQSMATMSSAQIISPTAFQNKMALQSLSRPTYPATGGVSLNPSTVSSPSTTFYVNLIFA